LEDLGCDFRIFSFLLNSCFRIFSLLPNSNFRIFSLLLNSSFRIFSLLLNSSFRIFSLLLNSSFRIFSLLLNSCFWIFSFLLNSSFWIFSLLLNSSFWIFSFLLNSSFWIFSLLLNSSFWIFSFLLSSSFWIFTFLLNSSFWIFSLLLNSSFWIFSFLLSSSFWIFTFLASSGISRSGGYIFWELTSTHSMMVMALVIVVQVFAVPTTNILWDITFASNFVELEARSTFPNKRLTEIASIKLGAGAFHRSKLRTPQCETRTSIGGNAASLIIIDTVSQRGSSGSCCTSMKEESNQGCSGHGSRAQKIHDGVVVCCNRMD
ncbi:hypothetical protein BDB00DRAFT_917643, partial [Zychaea mexicana]|uniref:uncharacterized protein n=1 Tax=Zychaea mexicana TaxID=64656 RepID=UPI0022FE5FBB